MRVAIICAVTGNLPVVKECMDTWFPLPENWELLLYKSMLTYIDGTSDYVDAKKKEERVTVVEDGVHRGHAIALGVLMEEIKKKDFDWVVHLDTDAKLLNREFYAWAEKVFSEEKYKVWGRNHIRASSKIEDGKNILYLGRAHSWIILANVKFLLDNDISFDDLRIEAQISTIGVPPKYLHSRQPLKGGDKIKIFGDTGWQLYTEAARFGLYQNFPDEIYKMWQHKNNQSEIWKNKNIKAVQSLLKTIPQPKPNENTNGPT